MNSIFRKNNLIYFLVLLAVITGFIIIDEYGIGSRSISKENQVFFGLIFIQFYRVEFLKIKFWKKLTK